MGSLKLEDLKEAKYNPRVISDKRLDNLSKSMRRFGDMSGVVFNKNTNTLVSGHQRLKTIRVEGAKTKIITKKVKDNFGTVEEGTIVAQTNNGEIRIPFRVVNWSDKKVEMLANIAANAHGGDFDRDKLKTILTKVEGSREFDVDTIGLDPLSMRTLMGKVDTLGAGGSEEGEAEDEFPSFDENSFELEHTCPKCKFQFNTSAASKNGNKPKVNKRVEATKATLAKKAAKKAEEEKKSKKKSKDAEKSGKSKKSSGDKPAKKKKKLKVNK